MRKLRILCLHGYHGSADVLRKQMKTLTDGLNDLAEFECVDAPSLARGDFGWWHAVEHHGVANTRESGSNRVAMTYEGWDETCRWVVAIFANEGPFDGVFGFSQGGALAALLVGLRAPDGKPTEHQPLSFGFAILVGAFAARDLRLATLYESTANYDLPSIHIIGRADSVVPSQASRSLAFQFNRPLILEHDGGHVIAANPEIRAQVAKFLEACAP
ncbi:Serine hydrolase (FSH1) [Burkholderia sp. OK233]|nr:Serine hydrolase (FSH1) [Burkholderia sp. OK233]